MLYAFFTSQVKSLPSANSFTLLSVEMAMLCRASAVKNWVFAATLTQ